MGESFRYIFPRFVKPSYGIAFAYVLADASYCCHKDYVNNMPSSRIMLTFIDTLMWQTLASVLIPGGTIFCVVRATKYLTQGSKLTFLPTMAGLCSVPIIIHPIDNLTD